MGDTEANRGFEVELAYELRSADGEVLEKADASEPLRVRLGDGDLMPAVEAALEGAAVGDEIELTLSPEEAFGPHDPELILALPRDELPPDVRPAPGDAIEVEIDTDDADELEVLECRVLEVNEEALFVDANHPLAGRQVQIWARVLGVGEGAG